MARAGPPGPARGGRGRCGWPRSGGRRRRGRSGRCSGRRRRWPRAGSRRAAARPRSGRARSRRAAGSRTPSRSRRRRRPRSGEVRSPLVNGRRESSRGGCTAVRSSGQLARPHVQGAGRARRERVGGGRAGGASATAARRLAAQLVAGAVQPHLHGPFGDAEPARDRRLGQVLAVAQLEQLAVALAEACQRRVQVGPLDRRHDLGVLGALVGLDRPRSGPGGRGRAGGRPRCGRSSPATGCGDRPPAGSSDDARRGARRPGRCPPLRSDCWRSDTPSRRQTLCASPHSQPSSVPSRCPFGVLIKRTYITGDRTSELKLLKLF